MFGLQHLLRRPIIGEKNLLILLAGLTFLSLINAVPVNVNGTNINNCEPNCTVGYECVNGSCVRSSCDDICPSEVQYVCGFNGKTYLNQCELEKQECIHKTNIGIRHSGKCQNCTEFKIAVSRATLFPNLSISEYYGKHYTIIKDLARECKTLTMNPNITTLMAFPFKPSCSDNDEHVFNPLQTNHICDISWCSTSDGHPIMGTFTDGELKCDGRRSCKVDNDEYKHGDSFIGDCGICFCSNGTVKCFNDYCGQPGNLSNKALATLKSDILQMFAYQYNNGQHSRISLMHIRENPIDIHPRRLPSITEWKFKYYDLKNKDRKLQHSELLSLHTEVYNLIGTKSFQVQLEQLLDSDSNNSISEQEWNSYFTLPDSNSSKRKRRVLRRLRLK